MLKGWLGPEKARVPHADRHDLLSLAQLGVSHVLWTKSTGCG